MLTYAMPTLLTDHVLSINITAVLSVDVVLHSDFTSAVIITSAVDCSLINWCNANMLMKFMFTDFVLCWAFVAGDENKRIMSGLPNVWLVLYNLCCGRFLVMHYPYIMCIQLMLSW